MNQEKIPILYLYIHSMMWKNFKEADERDLCSFLFQWRIPKELRQIILKEMQMFNLLEIKDRRAILSRAKFDIENLNKYHRRKYYERLNLF